jgi:hypothetical protein
MRGSPLCIEWDGLKSNQFCLSAAMTLFSYLVCGLNFARVYALCVYHRSLHYHHHHNDHLPATLYLGDRGFECRP